MLKINIYLFNSELIRTEFSHPLLPMPKVAIRGKTQGAIEGAGTFQWTSAVQAMTYLLLISAANFKHGEPSATEHIEGNKGSMATTLDFAISKEVLWLQDIFGLDSRGETIARRLFLRTNSNGIMPGPVFVSLNYRSLPPEKIEIVNDNKKISGADIRNLADQILRHFEARKLKKPTASGEVILPAAA